MGSTFVTLDPSKSDTTKVFGGSTRPQTIWLQWVPGIVGQVTTGTDSVVFNSGEATKSRRLINSILAKPHLGDNKKNLAMLDDEDRYYPLFRGMVDVPMAGDPVLLCTIGGVQYYIGPLNTAGVPGYNPDHLETSDTLGFFKEAHEEDPNTDTDANYVSDIQGISKNWVDNHTTRLEKLANIELDDPDNTHNHLEHPATGKEMLGDIHGDLMLEGRHGNSIRIGSRNINPYIYISNTNISNREHAGYGSLIGILDRGTIRQHFAGATAYVLSSDNPEVNDSIRKIGGTVYNYDFGSEPYFQTQLFQISDRITIDSRHDSIFLSANKNVIIGAADSLIVKTKNDIMFDANNIYLGKAFDDSVSYEMEQAVMGNTLVEILEELLDGIGELFVGGTMGGISVTAAQSASPGWLKLDQQVRRKLNDMLSNFIYIEKNDTPK